MKILIHLIASCSLILLLGCGLKVGNLDVGKIASSSAKVISGGKISAKEQQQIGDDMAAIILGTAKMNDSAKLQSYLNKVGRWVALHSESSSQNWQFILVDSDDFNAFSTPSAKVIISTGVLARINNEAELAGVIAHEIAHVNLKHQIHAIEKSNVYSGLGDLAFSAADANKAKQGGYSNNSMRNRKIAEGLFNITHDLYTKGLGREDELAADRQAVVLMARAGYDPYEYIEVLKVLQSVDAGKKALFLATHPKIVLRLEAAYNTIAAMRFDQKSVQTNTGRYATLNNLQ